MNDSFKLAGFGIELVPLTIDKLEMVRAWRNHVDVAKYMLDQSYISTDQQISWFNTLSCKEDQLHLLIRYKGEYIGVVNAKSLDGSPLNKAIKVSPGLYISPSSKYRNSILAFSPSLVFIEYLFNLKNTHQLLAQVLPNNSNAIRYNESLGYKKQSVDEQGIITMQLVLTDFECAKNKLAKILRF